MAAMAEEQSRSAAFPRFRDEGANGGWFSFNGSSLVPLLIHVRSISHCLYTWHVDESGRTRSCLDVYSRAVMRVESVQRAMINNRGRRVDRSSEHPFWTYPVLPFVSFYRSTLKWISFSFTPFTFHLSFFPLSSNRTYSKENMPFNLSN